MSAPSCIGRCSSGVANTLSTTTSAPACLAIFDTACDIDEFEYRIGRRLEEEGAGVRPDRLLPRVEIAPVDQRGLDAVARQQILDDVAAAAEQRACRDHMVAGLEMAEQRGGDGGHAARGAARGVAPLQRAHAPLEHGHGGVGVAAIDVAVLVALEARLGLLGALIDIARVEEDGFRGLAELAAQRALMYERRVARRPALFSSLVAAMGQLPLICSRDRAQKNPDFGFSQKTGIG